jgi:hypothetical protein
MTFDPDATAIRFGEGHLIPPTVRRLSTDQIHAWYPDEFHSLRGRSTCGCPEGNVEKSTLPRRARGAIEL